MDVLDQPLRSAEFLAVDTETNGLAGDRCELTEVAAVLVGGGELHDRFTSLCAVRAPLSRGIQRFTGITQTMLDEAPEAEVVLGDLVAQLEGRVLVAHNAGFDRRVLAQACERAGLPWPDPPALCTLALARRFAPLARQRKLGPLAESLGIEVETQHRALADAETCARVLCALLPKLAAHATTVREAIAALRPGGARSTAPRRRRAGATDGGRHGARRRRATARPDLADVPDEPGVYIFRNAEGQALYVGKSVALRTRARAHFAPSSEPSAWTAQATVVDFRQAASELGALVLENRLIKRLAPPGNTRLKHQDRYVYVRCRLDIPFPVLEVAAAPAHGHAVNIGPLRGRAAAGELVEQLNSLFGLRHCGRKLPRRDWPSAYGQMGRCLSPCLQDLDPNLYRRRLDAALALFTGRRDGATALLDHVDAEIRAAADAQRYERAAGLRRRRGRLEQLLSRLDGALAATHARPRLVRAPHPRDPARGDLFWLVDGRVADWGPTTEAGDLDERTRAALRGWDPRRPATHVPADEVDEVRIVAAWVAANAPPALSLDPRPDAARLAAFAAGG
ncbi:MAG TPA: exonuclease domain-containing protein [Capillimicrobium sp.]|nr:exonuclease domain-containing protein [Capillimicrobium sp.]